MFYDIETSKGIYSGFGQGWNKTIGMKDEIVPVKIICICWQWEGIDETFELRWDKGDDKKLVKKFIKELNKADEIVAHNGDGFDLPRIRARAIIHGLKMDYDYPAIDTLKLARKRAGKGFKFESNRLDYIAQILGVGAKITTNGELWDRITYPSFLPGLYPITKDYYKALDYMVKYCHMDIEVLKKVYEKLQPYVPHKHHAAVMSGGNKWDCPKCTSGNVKKNGTRVMASGYRKNQLLCKNCKYQWKVPPRVVLNWEQWKLDVKLYNESI